VGRSGLRGNPQNNVGGICGIKIMEVSFMISEEQWGMVDIDHLFEDEWA